MSNNSPDPFSLEKTYPEAAQIFRFKPEPLTVSSKTAIIVVDTNVLLLPYGVETSSLTKIGEAYRRLAAEKRLLVPARVVREFARLRAVKITELHKQLSDHKSRCTIPQMSDYKLLEGVKAYDEARKLETEMQAMIKRYQHAIGQVVSSVRDWVWDDPVSELYRSIFTEESVVESPLEEIQEKLKWRFANKVPPGYKDNAKDDEGIGDLLIWYTILEIGRAYSKSVIFVTGEEKADWQYRSAGSALLPRFELVDEFRRASDGKSLHIITLSKLLEIYNVSKDVVDEVRQEEIEDQSRYVNLSGWFSSSVNPTELQETAIEPIKKFVADGIPVDRIFEKTNRMTFVTFDTKSRAYGYRILFVETTEGIRSRLSLSMSIADEQLRLGNLQYATVILVARTRELFTALKNVLSPLVSSKNVSVVIFWVDNSDVREFATVYPE